MRMDDPKPTFAYLVSQLAARHPGLAYIHVIEPRIGGPLMAPRDVRPGEVRSARDLHVFAVIDARIWTEQ